MVFQVLFLDQPLLLVIILVTALTIIYYYSPIFQGIRNYMVYHSFYQGN